MYPVLNHVFPVSASSCNSDERYFNSFVWFNSCQPIKTDFHFVLLPPAWQVVESRRAEFSPAQFTGPKKISLNHLLNFTFEPRGGQGGSSGVGDGHSYWGRRNKWGHKHKPFNKELFLQAK